MLTLRGPRFHWALLEGAILDNALGLPDVPRILKSIPRNEKGEYVLCKVFEHTAEGRWLTPFSKRSVYVEEGEVVRTTYVASSPTVECGYGLHVATREWCKKFFTEMPSIEPSSTFVPFEIYTDWVFVPLVGQGQFRCYWYRIGPQLGESCHDL